MVNMKYIILADSNDKTFDIPRQLIEINGEPLIARTIRLLKENGVKDIVITAKDKRFDEFGVKRYHSLNSDFDYITRKGYWLNAFPFELMNEPVCFIWGDVYFSEYAIKKIVKTETKDTLFFCTYNNKSYKYIKEHDEPLAYKVVNTRLFKAHIEKVKKMKDAGLCCREPIVWEVYRSINGIDVNTHLMTNNYIAINDESCDIDSKNDIILLKKIIGGIKMIKCEVIKEFTLERFDELKNIKRINVDTYGKLYVGDKFECEKEIADYLLGGNDKNEVVIKVIEFIPEEVKPIIDTKVESENIKPLDKENIEKAAEELEKHITKPKTTKKKTSKK